MQLHALTLSIGNADYLAETIKRNQIQFDTWTIVTSEDDHATLQLVEKAGLRKLLTTHHHDSGKTLNAATAINAALERIEQTTAFQQNRWLLKIDADILLPKYHRAYIEALNLDPANLYCCIGDLRIHRAGGGHYLLWSPDTTAPPPRFANVAGETNYVDAKFANQWPTARRHQLPPQYCTHLGPTCTD